MLSRDWAAECAPPIISHKPIQSPHTHQAHQSTTLHLVILPSLLDWKAYSSAAEGPDRWETPADSLLWNFLCTIIITERLLDQLENASMLYVTVLSMNWFFSLSEWHLVNRSWCLKVALWCRFPSCLLSHTTEIWVFIAKSCLTRNVKWFTYEIFDINICLHKRSIFISNPDNFCTCQRPNIPKNSP